MDIHTRITAALHIVIGVPGAGMMLVFALGTNWIGHFIAGSGGGAAAVVNFFFGFGSVLAGFFALLLATETIAGTALLKGSPTGFVVALPGKRQARPHHIEGRP